MSTKAKLFFLLTTLCLIGTYRLHAQLPAFPGAEGAGMYTTGGRGNAATPTTVFEVTNLNDDGLPGSLRYALTTAATYRTVVFRVSGTIHLLSKLSIKANTTIAGQTAPGDGICVADYPVSISGDNVIVRYMRFRLGDKNQKKLDANGNPIDGSGGDDAFGATGPSNIIIDHVTASWSDDEALTIYRGDNLSIQWCMISEPLNYSYHFETGDADYEQHGYGGIWGAKRGSMHHNLIAHCRNRNPRFSGISTYTPNTVGVENCDFRNNVIYNWGINTVYGGDGGNYNVVNNYYKYGPNTGSGVRYRICNPSYGTTTPYGKWYVDGNYVDGSPTYTADNWSGGVVPQGGTADIPTVKATTAFDLGYPLTTQTATDAYEAVLQGAGCSLPNRDTLDQRIANDVRNRTGRIIDVQGGYPHGTPYEQTVTAWPTLASLAPPADSDHDGMPDSWETSNGLNPNDAGDRNGTASNGYTNLENYLNSLASGVVNTNPVIYANSSFNSFSQIIGSPSATQTFSVSGANLTSDIVLTAPANYQLSLNGTTWSSNLTLTPNAGAVSSTTISVRLNATTTGTYNGNISATSTGATTINIAVNGSTTQQPVNQKQIIGIYPAMEGGFENQSAGAVSTAVPTGAANPSPTVWTTSGIANILSDGTARTGSNYFTYTSTSLSTKNNYAPAVTSPLFTSGTKYIVQFYYRAPAPATGNQMAGLIATTDNSGTANFTTNYTYQTPANTNSSWLKFTGTQSLTLGYTPTTSFGGFRFNGGGTNAIVKPFDVDDFVVYPADNQSSPAPDVTGPNAATSSAATGSNSNITVTWTAPATGTDGGGYLVIRSTSASAPALNANGIYTIGNSIGAGNIVVYIGTITNFTDNGSVAALSPGTTYYYHIFTADKAFNYSAATGASASIGAGTPTVSLSGNLNSFSQTIGTPSASKSFSLVGSNLSNDVNINAPSGYELSEDDNTWSSSLTIAPLNNSINTTSFARLNASVAGSYAGNISANYNGSSLTTLAVSGTASAYTPGVVYTAANADVVVAKDGSGNFTTIQAAINAAPTGRTTPYVIFIKNGKYVEKVNIPSNKSFIHLIGESVGNTIISWDSYSGKIENGVAIGTSTSATLTVNASDFFMMSVTVENSSGYVGDGPQALALYVVGDRCAYKNCRFISGQDTVWHNGDGKRHYFKDCYIDGNTDFIFGASTAVFDSCVIYPRDRIDGSSGGYMTASNTPAGQACGEVFRNCKITKNRGVTNYTMGRPWQNDAGTVDKKNNKTVLLNTTMGSSIKPEGWSTWDAGTNTSLITYAEYKSRKFNGDLVDVSQRVFWSKQLTDAEAVLYFVNSNLFGSWDPFTSFPALNGGVPTQVAVANFRAQRGASNTTISWNLCWPMSGIVYQVYRSTDSVNYTKIKEVNTVSDTVVAYGFTDGLPAKGVTYYYYVKAIKPGIDSNNSYTASVNTSIPLDGEFRSAGSGFWTNASSGNGTNAASIWEKYVASSKSWVLQAKGVQPSNVNVTIRSGHTVMIDGLKGANSLTIEEGAVLKSNGGYATPGSQTLRIGAGSAASVIIQNDGMFGGDANPDDLITLEFNPACASVLWTGSGVSKITRLRPLPANPNALSIVFDQDVNLSYNNAGFTAYYNNTSNTTSENITFTINKGKTIKLSHPSGSFSPTGTTTSNPGGNYTYNIEGTLDLSATTTNSNLVPFSTNAASIIALNIGTSGILKLGTGLNTVNTAPSASNNGKVVLTIADGGLVDATKTNNLNFGGNYFIVSGSGALKRAVGSSPVLFPIGSSNVSYNPAVLTNSGAADNFTVSVKNSFDQPLADANKVVNKQWTINEDVIGGSNLTAKFGWNSIDQANGFDLSQLLAAMQFKESNWKITAASLNGSGTTADPYMATAPGFKSTGLFGVTNYTKANATMNVEPASYTYDGNTHAASGFAYGAGGTEDKLTPGLTFVYKDASNNVLNAAPKDAGTYTVIASFAGNDYYNSASTTSTITINPKPLSISASNQTKECGNDLNLGTTAFTTGGLVDGDVVSNVSLTSDGVAGVGSYPIVPSSATGVGLTNYGINYVNGTLTITDVTAPVISYCPVVPLQCYNANGSYTIPALQATDKCGAVTISYSITGATSRSGTGADASGSFNEGVSTINWTVDDGHGNQTTCQTSVTVNAALFANIPDVYAMNPNVDAKNTIYNGYGPTSLTITAVPNGGTAPYTYKWNNGETSSSITVSQAGTYTALVTDQYGCTTTASITIQVQDVRCGNDNSKVMVCHNGKEVCINSGSVQDHLNHGDKLGSCNAASARAAGNASAEMNTYFVNLFPNPATDRVKLVVSKVEAGASLKLYNANGAQVRFTNVTNSTQTISVKGLAAGMYYLVIRNGKQTTTRKLVIK